MLQFPTVNKEWDEYSNGLDMQICTAVNNDVKNNTERSNRATCYQLSPSCSLNVAVLTSVGEMKGEIEICGPTTICSDKNWFTQLAHHRIEIYIVVVVVVWSPMRRNVKIF